MSDTSILPEGHPHFNCPACGALASVPPTSLFRWELEIKSRDETIILIMGTCDICKSSRVQWQETPDGEYFRD